MSPGLTSWLKMALPAASVTITVPLAAISKVLSWLPEGYSCNIDKRSYINHVITFGGFGRSLSPNIIL